MTKDKSNSINHGQKKDNENEVTRPWNPRRKKKRKGNKIHIRRK